MSAAPPDAGRRDEVWKDPRLVDAFVNDVRGGVPYAADQIRVLLRLVAAGERPVRRFVDLGCGSGVLARAVLAQHPAAQAVLVDFSEPMLAASRTALAGWLPAPHFAVGDLADPAWGEAVRGLAPYDLIASSYAIHHLADERKRTLYAEIHALLAPGGWFVNVEHVASASAWGAALADEVMVDSIHAFRAATGGAASRAQVQAEYAARPDRDANILAPVDAQCAWLRAIGFRDVDCFFKVFELAVFGGRR